MAARLKWRYCNIVCGISIFFGVLLVSIFLPCFVADAYAANASYRDEVLARAKAANLHEDRYWQVLVHYREGLFGIKSVVDDPDFFLAENGREDPEAELLATIRAFFVPYEDEADSAVCRFVARFEWIKTRLDIDASRLPVSRCAGFEAFMDENEPTSVSLSFPTSHVNSPASMFGHTLLTIETKDKTNLLAHSVSYAAETNETFGPAFAIKGLFGLYRGYFSVMPYYSKLQQYTDVDHRDIWEYRLNLTEDEIRRMMLHIREWETIGCRYYFFTRNCSYQLFLLIEAARPSVTLTQRPHAWVIPLDTIRLLGEEGLITGDALYRPSRTTKIEQLVARMSDDGKSAALALARGKKNGESLEASVDGHTEKSGGRSSPPDGPVFSESEKQLISELAAEYVQYLYTKDRIDRNTYQKRYLRILGIRSRLGGAAEDDFYPAETPRQPDKGHRSARLAMGGGVSDGYGFVEFRLRPAYHHLMDYAAGYVNHSQIVFADTVVRFNPGSRTLRLEKFDFIDIVSITPRNRFFKPLSWKVATGLMRVADADGDGKSLVYTLNTGGGPAYDLGSLGIGYAMLEMAANVGGVLERGHAVGIGASAGVLREFRDVWKMHVYARNIYFGIGDDYNAVESGVALNFAASADRAISVNVSRKKERDTYRTEAAVLLTLFF